MPGLVQSFLQQDYAGPLELVILNDRHDQAFVYESTGKPVSIINVAQQFPTLGDKRNKLVDLATFPLVAWWDDDDRFLPSHLTSLVRLVRQGYRGGQHSHAWRNDGKSLTYIRSHTPLCNAIMEKQAIIDAGGFPAQQMHQDVALCKVMNHKLHVFWGDENTGFPTFVHRIPGTSAHTHVGEFDDLTNSAAARAWMQGTVDSRVGAGTEPTGVITIVPRWGVDYSALAAAAWAVRGGT